MNIPEWFQDPRISGVSPEKLSLLVNLAEQLEGKKTQKEVMPIVMAAVASANRHHLQFTPDEFELIFSIMKEGKSEEEKQQMDATLSKAQQMFRQKK